MGLAGRSQRHRALGGGVALQVLFAALILALGAQGLDYDILALRQDWPPNSCAETVLQNQTCSDPFRAFSIWELAPVSKYGGRAPRECSGGANDTAAKFDAGQVSVETRAALACIWADNAGGNDAYWRDQWEALGSCTGLSIQEYFDAVVAFHSKVSMNATLAKAGMALGRRVDRDTLRADIARAWGGIIPWIGCYRDTKRLQYVEACFNASTFEHIDCVGAPYFPDSTRRGSDGLECSGELVLETEGLEASAARHAPPPAQCLPVFIPPDFELPTRAAGGDSGGGLSGGAIAGIVVGVVLAVALAAALFLIARKRRAAKATAAAAPAAAGSYGSKESAGAMAGSGGSPLDSMMFVAQAEEGSLSTGPARTSLYGSAGFDEGGQRGLTTPLPATPLPTEHASLPAGSLPASVQDPLLSYLQRSTPGTAASGGSLGAAGDGGGGGSGALGAPVSTRRRSSGSQQQWTIEFGELVVGRMIGEGSFGRVYAGEWHATPVAIKLLLGGAAGAAGAADTGAGTGTGTGTGGSPAATQASTGGQLASALLAKMTDEADIMLSLRHPNCVQIMGLCIEPPCLVTEFCERGSLTDCLRAARSDRDLAATLTWRRRLAMALDAAKGMLHLHARDIVHRDLKSPNLLVDQFWRVKVSDFNLSKFLSGDPQGSSSLAAMNPRWLAPEVMQGERPMKPADVFAFGVVLWELLTWVYGRWELPWAATNPWQIVAVVIGSGRLSLPATLPGPESMPADLQGQYVALMKRCWAQAAADRPPMQQVAEELRSMLAQISGEAPGSPS